MKNKKQALALIDQREVLGKQFRVYGDWENPLFLAKDVGEWLEHSNYRAMADIIPDDMKGVTSVYTPGGIQNMLCLTEEGLYFVFMRSDKPQALPFQREVAKILKTIRKTGGYVANENLFVESLIQNLDDDQKNVIRGVFSTTRLLNKRIEEQKPLVEFAKKVIDSTNTIDVGQLAKLAYDKEGVCIGRNRLFKWLKKEKFLYGKNLPYQHYINNGYFKIIEQTYSVNGKEKINTKTLVTGKGQSVIMEMLRKNSEHEKKKGEPRKRSERRFCENKTNKKNEVDVSGQN
jgi:anti-repressor protein